MKRKICVVTATRAEYGLLAGLMRKIQADEELELQLIVTGAHLLPQYGLTYNEIEADGFVASVKVFMPVDAGDPFSIVRSMGRCLEGMSYAFQRIDPDMLVVLGDRYELLPICSAALILKIPIAHISGGDITEGALDDQVRHAITKLALLHFPGTEESARRIIQMGESPERVFVVGEPGLDSIFYAQPSTRSEVATEFGLRTDKKWVLMTYHPETLGSQAQDMQRVEDILSYVLQQEQYQLVITGANADSGGQEINRRTESAALAFPDKIRFFMSLGHVRYVRFLHHTYCVVGNSSSGILEAPVLKLPVINIGDRQKGRFMAENIVACGNGIPALQQAFSRIQSDDYLAKLQQVEMHYGDGQCAVRILKHLKEFSPGSKHLRDFSPDLMKKVFHEL